MHADPLIAALATYQPFDATEAAHRDAILAFLAATPAPFSRSTQEGHITGSAVVVDRAAQTMLLLWHVKLQRWLQPGGHCEPDTDTDVTATALRELKEETGLTEYEVSAPKLFDLDVHTIPARPGEPEHRHYDIRFCFERQDTTAPTDGKWVPLTEIARLEDASLSRLAQKLLAQMVS